MIVLIADDESPIRHLVESMLLKWGYDVIAVTDGREAWEILRKESPPPMAILDRKMPGIDGVTVCRKVRETFMDRPIYLILLTGMGEHDNIVEGLRAGADDYVTKPFDPEELRARIQVGVRVIQLQMTLAERVGQLEEALAHVKQLQGLLPICSLCKKILNDEKQWQQIEMYIAEHSEARFTHGLCPECNERMMNLQLSQFLPQRERLSGNDNDQVLKTQEACKYLKISRPTFAQYIRLGRIRATRAGHGWKVMKSELDRFLRSGDTCKHVGGD